MHIMVYIWISSGKPLLDQQRFQEAMEKLNRAIELKKAKYVKFTFLWSFC